MRSNVFNGTQPSDEGCNVSTDGALNINCGQGTTLIDCDRGFNGGDYSDLSNTFAWNRTTSIVFRFDQQINISRITMFFWNSPSNSIIVPNVRMHRSNNLHEHFNPLDATNITILNRTDEGQHRVDMYFNHKTLRIQFQYLKADMNFHDSSEWIFLGEVQFCGE